MSLFARHLRFRKTGDQQFCQKPGSCTKRSSGLDSEAWQRKTRRPSQHRYRNDRSISLCSSFLFLSFFSTYVPSETSFFEASPLFYHQARCTVAPKAKGATPVSTLSSDPVYQGREGTPFSLSRHFCRPPNFLSSCEASCVGPQLDCWFPIGPPGSQILAHLRPIRTSAQGSTVCYLSPNVAHAYARSTCLGAADDQTLGTSLRSFLLSPGQQPRGRTRSIRLRSPSRLSRSEDALTDIETSLHA
ncbi:hypothetical protein GE21DRAFT_1021783 [Neurospora crassa]|nr:hypothetical protein GE21DRAFT_1021783 [Neurospora crassa]